MMKEFDRRRRRISYYYQEGGTTTIFHRHSKCIMNEVLRGKTFIVLHYWEVELLSGSSRGSFLR
jgi:hypothetical protein